MQDDVTGIEGDVNFLFGEQVIQDERLLNLEQTTFAILGDVDSGYFAMKINFLPPHISHSSRIFIYIISVDLQDTTLALDLRVTALKENGGDDGNSSVAELEVRVETLEGTAADHEKLE